MRRKRRGKGGQTRSQLSKAADWAEGSEATNELWKATRWVDQFPTTIRGEK
jgi:hypothetical protein